MTETEPVHWVVYDFDPTAAWKGFGGEHKNFDSESEVDAYIKSTGRSADHFVVIDIQRVSKSE